MKSPSKTESSPLSRSELAEYLFRLAEFHSQPRYGNLPLATALRNLSRDLVKDRGRMREGKVEILRSFTNISVDEVRSILANEMVNKDELIKLAGDRFSIPHSQLRRLRRSEIILAISDALAHEESLDIISSEARRSGRTN